MRDILFAFVWIALLPLVFVSTHVGVLLWVWSALLSPNELMYGFMSSVPFDRIVAVSTIFLTFIRGDKKDPYLDITSLLLVIFALIATISWLYSIDPIPLVTDLYTKLLKEIVLAFFITLILTTRAHIDRLIFVIVIALAFVAVREGLIFILTIGQHPNVGIQSIGDNNSVATAILMIIPLLYYLARYSALRIVRIGMLSLLGLSVVAVIATYSRGGFVGLVVLGGFMVKNTRHRFATLLVAVSAGVLLYLLAPETWFSRVVTIASADNDSSFMGRVVAWKISLLIALDHPLFGGGMHAVQNPIVWSYYRPYLDRVDFVNTPPADFSPHAAHSIYFEVLGDLGFIGLTLFLAILGIALWNTRQLNRMCRGHASLNWAADLARMLQISLVIFLTTGAALSMSYFELLYILVALLSRCCRTVRLTLAAETPEKTRQFGPRRTVLSPSGYR